MSAGRQRAAEVLAFPALRHIPAPSLPLKDAAYEKYLELATSLLNSQKLNKFTQSTCENIAALHGAVAKRLDMGLPISAKAITEINKLMKELQLVDESDAVAPTPGGKENRYDRVGVIIRGRAETALVRVT